MKIHIDTTIAIPKPRTIVQFSKALLPLFALVLVLSWGGDHGTPVSAQDTGIFAPAGGGPVSPDFFLEVTVGKGETLCTTTAFTKAGAGKKCLFDPGTKFLVQFGLNSLGTVIDYDEVYLGLSYSAGLTRQNLADECAAWPDGSAVPEEDVVKIGDQSGYYLGCIGSSGSTTNSTHTGDLGAVEFSCSTSQTKETITIVYGTEEFTNSPYGVDTMLFRDVGKGGNESITENNDGFLIAETLEINCQYVFPWDVSDGFTTGQDGAVTVADIFEVAGHFGATKPVCC
jgi:hypothetical protein